MTYEFSIFTGDGWVVTLLTDKPVDLGDVVISSIIVQPKEDYEQRTSDDAGGGYPRDVTRSEYRLKRSEEQRS